jgi:preprotein translocase subunit SecD
MNQYPLWKNLLILGVFLGALLLAVPNLFSQDPSIEITAARGSEVTEASVAEVRAALENAGASFKGIESREGGKLLVRFASSGEQLAGQERSSGPFPSGIAPR